MARCRGQGVTDTGQLEAVVCEAGTGLAREGGGAEGERIECARAVRSSERRLRGGVRGVRRCGVV